eukprot:7653042-Ditylum_brightwellii.AAC.1
MECGRELVRVGRWERKAECDGEPRLDALAGMLDGLDGGRERKIVSSLSRADNPVSPTVAVGAVAVGISSLSGHDFGGALWAGVYQRLAPRPLGALGRLCPPRHP